MAAPSTQPKNSFKGTISFADGTGTPVTLSVVFTKGDTTLPELRQHLNEDVIISARSRFIGLSTGAPSYPQVSFSAFCGNLVGSSNTAPGSPMEFCHGKGAYSANISTIGANRLMTIDVVITIEGSDWGDTADETITLEDCRMGVAWAEAEDGNTLSFTAVVLGSIVIANSTNTVTYAQRS
jgi:hypothetical protein